MDFLFPRNILLYISDVYYVYYQISQAPFERRSQDALDFERLVQELIARGTINEAILYCYMTNVNYSLYDIMELKGLTKIENPKHLDEFHKNMRYIVANADTFFQQTQREDEHEKLEFGITVRELISQARKHYKVICSFNPIPSHESMVIKESFTRFQHLLDAEINYLCKVRNQTS